MSEDEKRKRYFHKGTDFERALRLVEETEYPYEDIAKQTGYSSATSMSSSFKHHIGVTPKNHRRAHKNPPSICQAKTLLLYTDESISDIAARVEMGASQFSAYFYRHAKSSPSDFRETARDGAGFTHPALSS